MNELAGLPPHQAHEAAKDKTVYWTLSLYIPSRKLYGQGGILGDKYDPQVVREYQKSCAVSRELRDAIEPLFNDVADRETQGQVQDFLIATTVGKGKKRSGKAPATANDLAREHSQVHFHVEDKVSWTTEGRTFRATPPHLQARHCLNLRRYWFVHNDGAVSYHLAFSWEYEKHLLQSRASTYYFISLLQKLAAPKEFRLECDTSDVFHTPLGITPLHAIQLCECGAAPCSEDCRRQSFWNFVDERCFRGDAKVFFDALRKRIREPDRQRADSGGPRAQAEPERIAPDQYTLAALCEPVPLVEVPGLHVPRSRFLFYFHDKDFFSRLIPQNSEGSATNERAAEKTSRKSEVLVTDLEKFEDLLQGRGKDHSGPIELDPAFWQAFTRHDPSGKYLDYYFLSGFNQNIIDFINQDKSEILDGTDPIYPKTLEQQDEGFLVRFVNHRAMITYARYSRSLDVGNDYIGMCPYTFLIHVLSMHNEFLAKNYEDVTLSGIDKIATRLAPGTTETSPEFYKEQETAINRLKLDAFALFYRHKHPNVFRYDTEQDVFDAIEEARGTERRGKALDAALVNLEDYARDLETRHKAATQDSEEKQQKRVNRIVFVIGGLSVSQTLLALGQYLEEHRYLASIKPVDLLPSIAAYSFGALSGVVFLVLALMLAYRSRSTLREQILKD